MFIILSTAVGLGLLYVTYKKINKNRKEAAEKEKEKQKQKELEK